MLEHPPLRWPGVWTDSCWANTGGMCDRGFRMQLRVRRRRPSLHRRDCYLSARAGCAADLDLVSCRSSLCAHLGWAYRVPPLPHHLDATACYQARATPSRRTAPVRPSIRRGTVRVTQVASRRAAGVVPGQGGRRAAARFFGGVRRSTGNRAGTVAPERRPTSWSVLSPAPSPASGRTGRDPGSRGRGSVVSRHARAALEGCRKHGRPCPDALVPDGVIVLTSARMTGHRSMM